MEHNRQRQIEYAEVFAHGYEWCVRYTSEPLKSEVIALFGTNELPTAFLTTMPIDEVCSRLRAIPANAHTCFVGACSWEETQRRALEIL